MIDITFVPLWLERHLKSLGHPLTVVGTTEGLANILSPKDLENYKIAKVYFQQTYLVPQGLVKADLKYQDLEQNINDTQILSYLYGNTFVGSDVTTTPAFDINVIGDGVYVTVPCHHDTDGTNTFVESKFVTKLISTIVNYMPLEQIARTALYRNFVNVASSTHQ